ncbi:MAG: hypothetical protein ACI8ZB_005003 [Desulforhopalus sp.]
MFCVIGCDNNSNTRSSVGNYPLDSQVWLLVYKKSISDSCLKLETSLFCFSKTEDVCSHYSPIAFDSCLSAFKEEIPDSLSSKEVKEWSLKIGRCIAKEFIVNAGMDNIDLDKSTCQ